jgi:hypothetical protein
MSDIFRTVAWTAVSPRSGLTHDMHVLIEENSSRISLGNSSSSIDSR